MAIEVVPAIERDKGTALRAIVAHGGGEPATVLYAGDAANDAPALAAADGTGRDRARDWPGTAGGSR